LPSTGLMSALASCGHWTGGAPRCLLFLLASHAATTLAPAGRLPGTLQQPHNLRRRPLAATGRRNTALVEPCCNGPQRLTAGRAPCRCIRVPFQQVSLLVLHGK